MAMDTSAPRWGREYTIPLEGTPLYRTEGIIKVVTEFGHFVSVGRITRETFEDEEFQYIFQPYWEVIDRLPTSTFQGIPGINMERRQEKYYRVNYEPVFITERSPSRNREDLWELLEAVGLDYYDRFEWLLRTDMRAGNDNLIVDPVCVGKEEMVIDYIVQESEHTWMIEKQTNKEKLPRLLKYTHASIP